MIRYRLLLVVSVLAVVLAAAGVMRLEIETDIVRSLPKSEKVLSDAAEVFQHHPLHDQVAVDIMLREHDPDLLAACGDFLKIQLRDSGLFSRVGLDSIGEQLQELAFYTARNLPILFSAEELERDLAPLLEQTAIKNRLHNRYAQLGSMDGIGQEAFITVDPLGFKDLVLAKLALLSPSLDVRFYRGNLLSADGRHLLLTADPLLPGTDTASARAIAELLEQAGHALAEEFNLTEGQVKITPVGAYRAALDNELIIRHDVRVALGLATLGIALLLLFSFPRPLVGLVALLPAFAGSAIALFIYSLIHSSISIMVLGFGGAIISITVDHGISYLLFLDRPHETRGKDASREVFAIGIMAVITSIGAFLILSLSGFPIFTQLGQFTALGIFFSFLFVHLVLPRVFPTMAPGSRRTLPIQALVSRLYQPRKTLALAALLVAGGLLFFAKPHFHVQLSSMNTVRESTRAADDFFTEVWGSLGDRIILMHGADSLDQIQRENDRILKNIEQDIKDDVLTAAFVPSMIFPGPERREENLAAWRHFWNEKRVDEVRETVLATGRDLGFTADAFGDFFSRLDPAFTPAPSPVPTAYYDLMGISKSQEAKNLRQFITALPGDDYQAPDFIKRYDAAIKVFDSDYFTERLAAVLFSTFIKILAIIATSLALLLTLFYLNLQLTLLTLLPVGFAYVCTLATLNVLGHPLDLPALMLSIVILGMGIDYSIFFVRAYQRYRDIEHPSYILANSGIFLAASSTLIGFGALCFAEHSLLRSIGITSSLGLAFSLIGTFLLLPALLKQYFGRQARILGGMREDPVRRIRHRYRTMETYPRLFARLKLRFDPIFTDLLAMLAARGKIGTIIDIGCGYGVPASWCLEHYPGARIVGIDPDPEKVRVCAIAVGDRGTITRGTAPALPPLDRSADVVLLLDMLHYLDDEAVRAVFANSFHALAPGGILAARVIGRSSGRASWAWRLEDYRIKLAGKTPHYRSTQHLEKLLHQAGFLILINQVSTANPELSWLVGQVGARPAAAEHIPA